MTSFSSTRSRKISLVLLRSSKRLKFFNLVGTNTYEKVLDFVVEKLNIDGVEYAKTSSTLLQNTFKYDIKTRVLSFKTNGANPESVYSVATFIHYFSNLPVILPYDLATGDSVEFEPRLQDLGAIKLELDSENSGISLESDSSISLESNDGYFRDIFDTHIFENKPVEYYYWFENKLPSEAKLAYRGVIQDKSFNSKAVKFLVKDNFLVLRDNLKLNLFDIGDGSYNDDLFLKPKRRVYGEVSKLKVEGTDKLKGQFTGVGTVSGSSEFINGSGIISGVANYIAGGGAISSSYTDNILHGSGTSFLSTLMVGSKISLTTVGNNRITLEIASVLDNVTATLVYSTPESFSSRGYSYTSEFVLLGSGTSFTTQVIVGSTLNYNDGISEAYLVVKQVVSDTHLVLKNSIRNSISGISYTVGSDLAVQGTDTLFLRDLSVGDTLEITLTDGSSKSIGISDIISDTLAILSEKLTYSFLDLTYKIKTDVYSKHFNRTFNIAGHALVELIQPITTVVNNTTFEVSEIDGYEVGSLVTILGNNYTVVRAYENTIILNQNVSPLPSVGDTIDRVPCFKAYHGINELVYGTHYDISNSEFDCTLNIFDTAEADITQPVLTTIDLVFTNGSNVLTTTSSIDLTTIFTTRDLIKPNNITYNNYYEVLLVTETQVKLRQVFSDTSITTNGLHKKVKYITDESIVAVDCLGLADNNGKWIRYPSEIVKHLLEKDAGQIIDSDSFLEARSTAEFKVSCYFPESIGDESPVIRDCITKINNSVFGSLYYNSDYQFKYSILNSNKPENIQVLNDDDIISYDIATKNNIINRAKINYKPHTDLVTGDTTFETITKESDFVNKLIGYSKEKILNTILFSDSDATIILERFLFFNSLTNSLVKIKSKLNLITLNLNDPIKLNFDRLYKRYSGFDNTKIGIVNYIERDETTCNIQVNDLAGVFNRVPAISPNTVIDIGSSDLEDIAKYGFIVDNLLEVPDNTETYLGTNLIG